MLSEKGGTGSLSFRVSFTPFGPCQPAIAYVDHWRYGELVTNHLTIIRPLVKRGEISMVASFFKINLDSTQLRREKVHLIS